jgi:hypothetical protein
MHCLFRESSFEVVYELVLERYLRTNVIIGPFQVIHLVEAFRSCHIDLCCAPNLKVCKLLSPFWYLYREIVVK